VGRLVVAGGETAGACVQALGLAQLRVGPQIDPGVPWCHARLGAGPAAAAVPGSPASAANGTPAGPSAHPSTRATGQRRLPGLHLALKSGNFGGPDLFTRAFQMLS
jgi:uncharacterized protein YgbK (DUF1537 family)